MKPCPVCSRAGCRIVAHQIASNAVVNAPVPVVNAVVNAKQKDRHRKQRNDYFRSYMKVWRAIKSGRAMPWSPA